MKVRFESHWVGKMDGGGSRSRGTRQAPSPFSLPKPTLSTAPVRMCPAWSSSVPPPLDADFFFSSAEEVQSYKENDPEPSLGREGQGVRYLVSPRRRKQKQKEAAERPRLAGGREGCSCRGIWTQPGMVRTWRDRRARSPGHRAPSARAVRSLQA